MAIDFYNLISPSLKRVIEKRKKSEIELYAEHIANNKENIITRTDLRNLNIVTGNKFKKFFEEHFDEVKEELENVYGLLLYPYEGKGNVKAYQMVKK
jgi:ADP-dependent phosphofructokinase/glucokinase